MNHLLHTIKRKAERTTAPLERFVNYNPFRERIGANSSIALTDKNLNDIKTFYPTLTWEDFEHLYQSRRSLNKIINNFYKSVDNYSENNSDNIQLKAVLNGNKLEWVNKKTNEYIRDVDETEELPKVIDVLNAFVQKNRGSKDFETEYVGNVGVSAKAAKALCKVYGDQAQIPTLLDYSELKSSPKWNEFMPYIAQMLNNNNQGRDQQKTNKEDAVNNNVDTQLLLQEMSDFIITMLSVTNEEVRKNKGKYRGFANFISNKILGLRNATDVAIVSPTESKKYQKNTNSVVTEYKTDKEGNVQYDKEGNPIKDKKFNIDKVKNSEAKEAYKYRTMLDKYVAELLKLPIDVTFEDLEKEEMKIADATKTIYDTYLAQVNEYESQCKEYALKLSDYYKGVTKTKPTQPIQPEELLPYDEIIDKLSNIDINNADKKIPYVSLMEELAKASSKVDVIRNEFSDKNLNLEDGLYTNPKYQNEDLFKLQNTQVEIPVKKRINNKLETVMETHNINVVPVHNMGAILERCDNILKYMRTNPPDASQLNPMWEEVMGSDVLDASNSASKWKDILAQGVAKIQSVIKQNKNINLTNVLNNLYNKGDVVSSNNAIEQYFDSIASQAARWQQELEKPEGFQKGEPYYESNRNVTKNTKNKENDDIGIGWKHMYNYLGATAWINTHGEVVSITQSTDLDQLKSNREQGKNSRPAKATIAQDLQTKVFQDLKNYCQSHKYSTDSGSIAQLIIDNNIPKKAVEQIISKAAKVIPFQIGIGSKLTNNFNKQLGIKQSNGDDTAIKTAENFREWEKRIRQWINICKTIEDNIQKYANAEREFNQKTHPEDSQYKLNISGNDATLWSKLLFSEEAQSLNLKEWYNGIFNFLAGSGNGKPNINLDGVNVVTGGTTYGEKLAWMLTTPSGEVERLINLTDNITESAISKICQQVFNPSKTARKISHKRLIRY